MNNILVTGAAGYIGSMLSTKLVENKKNFVTAVDLLKYDKNSLSHLYKNKNFKFIKEDIRKESVIKKIIKKQDIIFPLAALVGAPLCEKFKNTIETNINSLKLMIKNLKKEQKIIYPTTNSGYGVGAKNRFCDENSPLNPISLYGTTKADAEKIVLKYGNSVCFRLATVFGYSYRMRTDLLVNNFVERAIKKNKLELFEAHFRRNYIHISDVVDAFIFAIENFKKLKGNTYNLGLSSANLTKYSLAKLIQKQHKKLKITQIKNKSDPDKRDYFVSNKKIESAGFKATFSLENGISELIKIFEYSDVKFKNNY